MISKTSNRLPITDRAETVKPRTRHKLLIIDAGHSRLKLHRYQQGSKPLRIELPLAPFNWPEGSDFSGFEECLHIGSHERMNIRINSHLKQLGEPRPLNPGIDLKIPLESHTSDSTGCDRLIRALGAKQHFTGKSCLIVCAGSALVVDWLNEKGQFCGGLIGLGWHQYRDAMLEISPRLKTDDLNDITFPAEATEPAVGLGWLKTSLALIENLIREKKPQCVILSGGDAGLLESHLENVYHLPHLGADAMAQELGYFKIPPPAPHSAGIA